MATQATVDLHKLARFLNLALPILAAAFFAAGYYVSFYFHFGTVVFLLLTIANFFYRHVQTRHAILRNFGIVGQVRYILESVGPELRQYLFANNREERPFNRNERAEVYRKAKGVDSASSFGSQKEFDPSEIKIRHAMYPLDHHDLQPYRVTFGEERGLDTAYTIHKHMMISAMSYGSLGRQAIYTLSRGAKMAGIPMNTGEGGYPKHHLVEGSDLVFQMGTAKFGCRNEDGSLNEDGLRRIASQPAVKMIEIKFSQGAKPGKGGLLPKEKISQEIADLRGVPMGKDVISPAYHVECRDTASTVELIRRVQEVSGLPTGIKFCVGSLEDTKQLVQAMVQRDCFPDYIAIDGAEGGTGAAPRTYLDNFGLPLLPALAGVNDILVELGVRDRLKLVAAGKLITAGRQLIAMCLGADAIYSARGFMLAIGCIQAMLCGNNTCPVGITTHDESLQAGLVVEAKAHRVTRYVDSLEHEFQELLCSVGAKNYRNLSRECLFVPTGSILAEEVR